MMNENVEVRIYNPALELQGIIDEFSSLIWIRRYQTNGEFELRTPYSDENRLLLVAGNLVQKFDGMPATEAGVVESIDMDADEMIIKGRFLESYLSRRLIKDTAYYSGRAEDSMRGIVSSMVAIPKLFVGVDSGTTETLEFQATYKSVQKIIEKVCNKTALGFRIRPDFVTKQMLFEIFKGVDRSDTSGEMVIFSEKYDNIFDERYTFDDTETGTKCYAWQIVNDVRMVYSVGSGTGLDLREFALQTSVDTEERTTAQIRASMEHQAELALAKKIASESFTFSTDAEAPFIYRTDYDLGDIVRIRHKAWDIDLTMRLSEIEEDYDDSGRSVVLTCGDPLPEVADFEED